MNSEIVENGILKEQQFLKELVSFRALFIHFNKKAN